MTSLERRRAMESHILLKEKDSGEIKGRTVADGRSQREHTPKEKASSPTPSLESILLTCVIEAKD
jgi:hypothetical protein